MAGIRVEGAEELQRKVSTMADRIRATIVEGLQEVGRGGEKKLKDSARSRLRVRSGALLRSIGHAVSETAVEIGVLHPEDGQVLQYAVKQDQGGTITAKSARFRIQNLKGKPLEGPFLRIPVGSNVTPAGVDRGLPGFYLRTRTGNFVGVQGSGGGLDVINVLKRSVTIPKSGWFSEPVKEIPAIAQNLLRARIERVLSGAA